jgi:hypothetical protein
VNSLQAKPHASLSSCSSARRLVAVSARWGSYALGFLLLAAAATLWFRYHAMAFRRPLDGPGLFLAGVLGAGAAAAARSLLRRTSFLPGGTPRHEIFEPFLSLCVIAWGVALSLTAAHAGGLVLLWASLVVEEAWAWRRTVGVVLPITSQPQRPGLPSSWEPGPSGAFLPVPSETKEDIVAELPRILSEPGVFQEFVRTREAGGGETLRAWVRVPLVAGQRNASVHLAFCPPFESRPTLDIVQRSGPEARIKVVQLLPLGAKLDVKLPQVASLDGCVILEVLAKTDAALGEERPKSIYP